MSFTVPSEVRQGTALHHGQYNTLVRSTRELQNVVRTIPSRGREEGGIGGYKGRWVPTIGGEEQTQLFISPGSVTYVRLPNEDAIDSGDLPPCEQEEPIWPMIENTRINADPAPSFDVADKSNVSVWLITQRMKCENMSYLPNEDDKPPERVEIYNRDQKPPREKGEFHRLLCKFDLETNDDTGAKTITNLDQRQKSDVDVPFKCIVDVDSNGSTDESDSDQWDSDDYDSSGDWDSSDEMSDSDDDPSNDCPVAVKARWVKKSCYDPYAAYVYVGWIVLISLRGKQSKCKNWKATIYLQSGIATPHPDYPHQTIEGGAYAVALTSRFTMIHCMFKVFSPPVCKPDKLTVKISSEVKEDDSDPDPCCGKTQSKEFPEMWPKPCQGSCTTPPPTPPG